MTYLDDIDLEATNPGYAGAMRLCDVRPGICYIVVDPGFGRICQVKKISSTWSIVQNVIGGLKLGWYFTATDSVGQAVNLNLDGIYPYEDGTWSENQFSVLATAENVKNLHAWLKAQGHQQSATLLTQLLPSFMPDLEKSFWRELADT